MASWSLALVVLVAFSCLGGITAQGDDGSGYTDLPQGEAQYQNNGTGVVYDHTTVSDPYANAFSASGQVLSPPPPVGLARRILQVSDASAHFTASSNIITSNPFLSTLYGAKVGTSLVKIKSCGIYKPHHHASSEMTFLSDGTGLEVGIVEEEGYGSGLPPASIYTLSAGQSITISPGLVHYFYNPTCKDLAYVSTWSDSDPRLVESWSSYLHLPTAALHPDSGVAETEIASWITSLSTGTEDAYNECRSACL